MSRYARASDVIADVVDGQLTVCNTMSGEVLELNGTGAALWSWCDDVSAEGLTAQLHEVYPTVDAHLLLRDVEQWLADATTVGLVQVLGTDIGA